MHNDAVGSAAMREATGHDDVAIAGLEAKAGMGALFPGGRAIVTERAGQDLGFIRIVKAEGRPCANPVVVDAQARHLRDGRALMDHARARSDRAACGPVPMIYR